MSLTEYVMSRIGLSPADLRQLFETARTKGEKRPHNAAIESAGNIIKHIPVLVEEWYAQAMPTDVLKIMEVPLDDFYRQPTIETPGDHKGLKNKSAAAIVYDYCAEAGLRPSLRTCLVLNSGARTVVSLEIPR